MISNHRSWSDYNPCTVITRNNQIPGFYIYMLLEGDTPIVTEQSFITEYVKDSCVLSTGNLKIIYNGN